MMTVKERLTDACLYLVLDRQVKDYDELFEILKISVKAGVDIVQLRDKNGSARDILNFSKHAIKYLRGRVPYIINDRVDLSLISGADGVHLGQDDIPLKQARNILGGNKIIGISCQTVQDALKAQRAGADYIGFGSVFTTLTKPERKAMDLRLLEQVLREIRIPVYPIGGITVDNFDEVFQAGCRRLAVTRSILLAKDEGLTVKEFKKRLAR